MEALFFTSGLCVALDYRASAPTGWPDINENGARLRSSELEKDGPLAGAREDRDGPRWFLSGAAMQGQGADGRRWHLLGAVAWRHGAGWPALAPTVAGGVTPRRWGKKNGF
jgi:hypothetical protein